MNKQAIKALSKAQSQAIVNTAQQMLNEQRNDFVFPFDTGNLQNESTYVDDSKAAKGKVSIVSDMPYARRLYYHPEYNFNTSKNPNARGEWWAEWLEGAKKSRPSYLFKEFYRRLTGGYVK
jgi:hypothetical protein